MLVKPVLVFAASALLLVANAASPGSMGENDLAKYISRRLDETDRAIDEFALRQKTLLRQDIAAFARSLAKAPDAVTSENRRVEEAQDQTVVPNGNKANHVDIQTEDFSTVLGIGAGANNQKQGATALGFDAGNQDQGYDTVAVGAFAGITRQGDHALAVGYNAGYVDQKAFAVALGDSAGFGNQGTYSVAIGANAGATSQHDNTIVISAAGATLNSVQTNSFYVKPIRGVKQASVPASSRPLRYDPCSGEVFFILPAPPTSAPSTNPTRPSSTPRTPVRAPRQPVRAPRQVPTNPTV